MLTTIKGVYDQGKITLTEDPHIKTKEDVMVTFLTDEKVDTKQSNRILGGLEGKVTIPADFNEPLEDFKDYM